jgi:hypothetical protein
MKIYTYENKKQVITCENKSEGGYACKHAANHAPKEQAEQGAENSRHPICAERVKHA